MASLVYTLLFIVWTAVIGRAVAYVVVRVVRSKRYFASVDLLPGPPALPIIGNAHQLKRDGHEFVKQIYGWMLEYGDVFRIWLGTMPFVAINSPEYTEIILKGSKHIDKSFEYDFLHPWLGTGLLTSTGTKWKARRRLLTPTFHFEILNDFNEIFREQALILADKLSEGAKDAHAHGRGAAGIDVFPFVTKCTLDIICETAMGFCLRAQNQGNAEYVAAVNKVSELVHERQKNPLLWPESLYALTPQGIAQRRALSVLHGFSEGVIAARREMHERAHTASATDKHSDGNDGAGADDEDAPGKRKVRKAFLDLLLDASMAADSAPETDGEVNYARLSNEDIREEVDTFMFEGHDTTAAAVTWALYLLAAHPDVQDKARREVQAVLGDRTSPTAEDLHALKYVSMVAKEALRLYPSVPAFARSTTEDCPLPNGVVIPKGTEVGIVAYSLHRNPKVWDRPTEFIPERFSPDAEKGRHAYAYVPFSAGPRNCIGQKFAQMEEKVLLATILRRFDMTTTMRPEELQEMGEVILRPRNGVTVTFVERTDAL